jgi:hypothetical protein
MSDVSPLASQFTAIAAEALRRPGNSPEQVYDALVLAVATFIAGSHGSPVDHRFAAEQFHARVMNEIPKARHRLAQLARQERG